MICTVIQNKELAEIQALLKQLEMAEIRLDRCPLDEEDIDVLFSESDVPLIATCRLNEEAQAPDILERAIIAGAKYVDLEMERQLHDVASREIFYICAFERVCGFIRHVHIVPG